MLKREDNIRIVVSGGGTGGHLFPAIAIADALKEKLPNAEFLFVGAEGKIEMEKVPQAGYKVVGLPISGFQRSLDKRNLTFPFRLVYSLLKSFTIVKNFNPHIAIGTGGYASGPTLKAAEWLGIPTVIQEQNAFPGVTNKLLGKKANAIFAAFDGLEKYFDASKIMVSGNPLRKSVAGEKAYKTKAAAHFGLSAEKPVIFITGGSLGARAINVAVEANLEKFKIAGVQLIWQCGKIYENDYKKYDSDSVKVLTFIDKMDYAYAAADIIISRAGASTISELALVGKATIMLPSPNVAEDHQTKNVLSLVEKDAAIMVKDNEAVELLGNKAIELLNDSNRRKQLGENFARLAKPNAAEFIADKIIEMLGIEMPHSKDEFDISKAEKIYFLGIGGIGMSALARYFNHEGKQVSGYDKTPSALTAQLQKEGINVHFTDDETTLVKDADMVVYTPAIPKDSFQLNYYANNHYRLLKRSKVLGLITEQKYCIAVAGSHGKTTVSSMIAQILNETIGCTAFLGGIASNFGSNYVASKSKYVVVEADEFDRSFLALSPDITVVTSIDSDHLDIYGSLENIEKEFQHFIELIDHNGTLIYKSGVNLSTGVKKLSYNLDGAADAYVSNYSVREGYYSFDVNFEGKLYSNFELYIGGRHNVENALAAVSVALSLGIGDSEIKEALKKFTGIKRRFEKIFESENLVYVDDYAHHPNELKAFIDSVIELYPEHSLKLVFQPHLFSRTRDLATDFAAQLSRADEAVIMPVYPARELPIEGVTSAIILDKMSNEDKKILAKDEILKHFEDAVFDKKTVVATVGAGDIDRLVEPLNDIFKNKI